MFFFLTTVVEALSDGCKLNRKEVKAGLCVGKEVRHTGVCLHSQREGCVPANSRDLIAILQQGLCEEMGQPARLPFSQVKPHRFQSRLAFASSNRGSM